MELGSQSVESTLNSTQRCWCLGRTSIGFQGDGCGSAQAIRSGFERAMEDGSYQELIDQTVFTPWLKKHLNLAKRKVVVLNNPNAAEVLSAVQPGHWIVPWHQLLQGDMNHGEQLCTVQQLKALCD